MKRTITHILTLALFLSAPALLKAEVRTIHVDWQSQQQSSVAGFRLYMDNVLVCETKNPLAKGIDCHIDTKNGEKLFTMTSFTGDGIESLHSKPFTYVFSGDLTASFAADTLSGVMPLPVSFDATPSSGDIVDYLWLFGDGKTASGAKVQHTFSASGNFNVTLRVTDSNGETRETSKTVKVTKESKANNPPSAVLATSSTVGKVPHTVTFNAEGSSDSDGTITSYQWDMGDGTILSGTKVTYTYHNSGTYHPKLTVTDNDGATASLTTPVLVEKSNTENTPPRAFITASSYRGKAPLTVTFFANQSSDADGKIVSYNWNFGDGTTATGETVKHTFTSAANFNVTLVVKDNDGASSEKASCTIKVAGKKTEETDSTEVIRIINNFLLREKRNNNQQ